MVLYISPMATRHAKYIAPHFLKTNICPSSYSSSFQLTITNVNVGVFRLVPKLPIPSSQPIVFSFSTMKIPDAPPVRMTRARAREMELAAAAAKGRGRPKAATTTTSSSRGDPQLDQENRSVAGLRAKPVRRPAAPKGAKKVSGGPPLSPKKAPQVAKAASVSSEEDELNGGKTPLGRPACRYGVGASAQVGSGVSVAVGAAGETPAPPPSRIPRKRGSSLSESVPALVMGGTPKDVNTPVNPASAVGPKTTSTRARKPAPVFLTRDHASPILPGEVEVPKKYRTPTNPAPARDASKYRTRPKSTPMYPTAGTITTTKPTVQAAAPELTTEQTITSKKTVVVTRETKIPTKPASTETAQQQRPAIIPAPTDPATPAPTKPVSFLPAKPTRRPRCGVNLGVLKGAVIHVDCRTSDGEDASEIFRELVIQLGAKVVKNWTWMRQSILVDSDQTISFAEDQSHGDFKEVGQSGQKVAVTHVIFKDGSERTLDKVRGLNGKIHCVGVRWLLE